MLEGRDSVVLTALLGLVVFVGVSDGVSAWFHAFYSAIAVWAGGALVVAVGIYGLAHLSDRALSREIRDADRQNATAVQALAAKHAAHPEVAKELAARLLQEKLARQQAATPGHPVPPSAA